MPDVVVEQTIGSSPGALYDLVSDVTRMGEWSPETTSCRWLGRATGPGPGAKFRGSNRDGWRRWFTTCTVTTADAGRNFTFDVAFGPFPVSTWSYEFAADGDGCVVTERWHDRRPAWMVRVSPTVVGVSDREEHNRQGMLETLSRLRAYAEQRH